ncbi:hypothetical protein [Chlamydiifrater volucris]|uniref:hypothetical protein n=1 Tax=Chlamydiifrater volucris TaxID=2681470 RepID=UPI001BCB8533|nr:hypothetical protein [Chlamydiifrater volucris]
MKKTKKTSQTNTRSIAPKKGTIQINAQEASFNNPLSMNGQKITNLGDPENDGDAVPYSYLKENFTVIGEDNNTYLPISGGTMSGPIDMEHHKIYQLKAPEVPKDSETTPNSPVQREGENPEDTSKNAVNIEYLKKSCEPLRSNEKINKSTEQINNLINRVNNIKHIVGFVSSNDDSSTSSKAILPGGNYVPTSGGEMTGSLDMNQNTVTGLFTEPKENDEAVCKQYLEQNLLTMAKTEPQPEAKTGEETNTITNKLIGNLDMNKNSILGVTQINDISNKEKYSNGASTATLKTALSKYTHPFMSGSISTDSSKITTLNINENFIWNPERTKIIRSKSADIFFLLNEDSYPSFETTQSTNSKSIALLNRGLFLLTWSGFYASEINYEDNLFLSVFLVYRPYTPPENPTVPPESGPTMFAAEIDNAVKTRVFSCRAVGRSTSFFCQIPLDIDKTYSIQNSKQEYFLELFLGEIPPITETSEPSLPENHEKLIKISPKQKSISASQINWQLSVLNF